VSLEADGGVCRARVRGAGFPACAEGRWVHATKSEAEAQQDWEICKTEVLSGAEHRKETMAGGINLSGCMQSKGYTYTEEHAQVSSTTDTPVDK
jgi:hypothetical protein